MKERKLNYRFHNPNSQSATADYLLKMFVKVNEKKVEEAIQQAFYNDEKTTSEAKRHPA